jgi:hypothetical protein
MKAGWGKFLGEFAFWGYTHSDLHSDFTYPALKVASGGVSCSSAGFGSVTF